MSASEALGPKFALQNVHEKRNSRRARGSDLALGSKCWPQRLVRNPVFSLGEFRRKILALLQSSEEQNGEQQVQVQEAEEAGESPAPACKVKSQRKKSNLRRAFSLRKHGSKDSKRPEASGTLAAASPEARPPKRHGFLPMCVGGHRASISSGPEESIIHKLVEGLQEVDSDLGRQPQQQLRFGPDPQRTSAYRGAMPCSRNPSPGMSPDSGDLSGLSPVAPPRGLRKPPADKRAQSLDRQVPKKNSESLNSKYPSGPTHKKVLRRTSSDVARGSGNPSHFAEVQEAVVTALPLGEGSEFLSCEHGPPEDTKKEKPPKQTQQSWASMLLNIFLPRTGLEESREKASRKSKGKGQTSKSPEAGEEPGLRKKSQEKRTSHKHGHRKPAAEEATGPQSSEAEGQEDILPSLAASQSQGADLGLICRGRPDPEIPQALPVEEGHADSSESSAGVAGAPSEEDPQKPDRAVVPCSLAEDEVIWKIVELLKKAGDHLEEEQVPQPEVVPPNPLPPPRKKSQERKASLKRALSLKKPASEEPKRGGAATAVGPETRPKRPGYLPLCISGQRASTSSNRGEQALAVATATAASLQLGNLPRAGIGQLCSDVHSRP
ncbi:hypothetical protein NN561_001799 [Cricetulus griseus]